MVEKLKEMIYCYGFNVGRVMVMMPIASDIIWKGGREWNFISIGVFGVSVQIVGLILMHFGGRDSK